MRIVHEKLGTMGTGTRMFRCGLLHSSGTVFIGTYGPQPATVWKYDHAVGKLEKVGAPGEYQLDCMVEAPNGAIYIGTAYGGLVYRLTPHTGQITDLGSPDIASTPWIFTMLCTRGGEIYGARGVGLFRLDWERDRLEPIGLVPGDHITLGPNPSNPIIHELVEAPDGTLYGDTNRWLFRFHPSTKEIEPLADMLDFERACYGLFLTPGRMITEDCYFAVHSRYSGERIREPFYVYRAQARRVEHLHIAGFSGIIVGAPEWWIGAGGQTWLLVPTWSEIDQKTRVSVVDPFAGKLVECWDVESHVINLKLLPGGGLYFITSSPAGLLRGDPKSRRVRVLAGNPEPVECRCLAISQDGVLAADTYDCGNVFTRDLVTGQIQDHGRVWVDDHRCNYGPAAFAGQDGRYFLANHSEGLPALWVTDTQTDRHWRVGPAAIQLVTMSDGSVWGTAGPSPGCYKFDPRTCWLPSWVAKDGPLFRYRPGAQQVEEIRRFRKAGPIAPAPDGEGCLLVNEGRTCTLYDGERDAVLACFSLPAAAVSAACDAQRGVAYLLLEGGSLYAIHRGMGENLAAPTRVADGISAERGLFVLPKSGRVLGVSGDGTVMIYDPAQGGVSKSVGAAPLPAGPAVDPLEDAWYYADAEVMRYTLE